MDLSVSSTEQGAVTVVHVAGEIDVYTAPLLREVLDKQVAAGRTNLVVDLEKVTFMDSTGLHAVLRIRQDAHELGRRFALIRGRDQVQRLFELTGLTESLTIVDSPGQLLEGWAPPEPTVMP